MPPHAPSPFAALRRFARPAADAAAPASRCELCSAELAGEHEHLVEPRERKFLCACQACAILFADDGRTRYRRVPRDVRSLTDFQLSDTQWETLAIPIGIVFFFRSSSAGRVIAIYPSPAGPTESLLPLDDWSRIEQENPALQHMREDTEALLVYRMGTAREHYLVPIDRCYELVGTVRAHWKGLSGGEEVRREIGRFFGDLRRKAGREGS